MGNDIKFKVGDKVKIKPELFKDEACYNWPKKLNVDKLYTISNIDLDNEMQCMFKEHGYRFNFNELLPIDKYYNYNLRNVKQEGE